MWLNYFVAYAANETQHLEISGGWQMNEVVNVRTTWKGLHRSENEKGKMIKKEAI